MSRISYNKKPLGIYIHIPFCVKKCDYCDFYSVTNKELQRPYVSAMLGHIREYGESCKDYIVDTIYIGGGTPSCLEPKLLGRILQEVHNQFSVDKNAEITVECNPESTDKKLLEMLKRHRVNRLSFGIQSSFDKELQAIGRIHSYTEAETAVLLAQSMGFSNINLDLMYGLPGQTEEMFLQSVQTLLSLSPMHLSCYGLKLEENTKMGRENPILPEEDEQAETYLAMCDLLRKNEFEHYEISNFAKKGFRSRHNSKYWDLSEYIGIGPGAHSFINGRRFSFARDLEGYISKEDIICDEDEVASFQRQGEYLMVRLRTAEGVDFLELEKRYQIDSTPYEEAFRALLGREIVSHQGTRWFLTEKGFLVSNLIINKIVEAGQLL